MRHRKHVFADLRPYVCTFESCPDGHSTYSTRRYLAQHLLTRHGLLAASQAQCPYHDCGVLLYGDEDSMVRHINTHYSSQTSILKPEKRARRVTACPLCGDNIEVTRRLLGRHIGRHMEEIAFLSVTKPYEEWKFYDDTSSSQSIDHQVTQDTGLGLTLQDYFSRGW